MTQSSSGQRVTNKVNGWIRRKHSEWAIEANKTGVIGNKGKSQTDSQKESVRISSLGNNRGKVNKGRNSPTKGMIWVSNGIEEKMINKMLSLDTGWKKGRNNKHKETTKISKAYINQIRVSNGRFGKLKGEFE